MKIDWENEPSILDKLVEKRHIMLLTELRIEELKSLMSPKEIHKIPRRQREYVRRELKGRLRELVYIRRVTGNKWWSREAQRIGHILRGRVVQPGPECLPAKEKAVGSNPTAPTNNQRGDKMTAPKIAWYECGICKERFKTPEQAEKHRDSCHTPEAWILQVYEPPERRGV